MAIVSGLKGLPTIVPLIVPLPFGFGCSAQCPKCHTTAAPLWTTKGRPYATHAVLTINVTGSHLPAPMPIPALALVPALAFAFAAALTPTIALALALAFAFEPAPALATAVTVVAAGLTPSENWTLPELLTTLRIVNCKTSSPLGRRIISRQLEKYRRRSSDLRMWLVSLMLEGASPYSNGQFIPARNNPLLQESMSVGRRCQSFGAFPPSSGPTPLPEDPSMDSAPQQRLTQPNFNMYSLLPPPISPAKPCAVNNDKQNIPIETSLIAPRPVKIAINPLSTLASAAARVSLLAPLELNTKTSGTTEEFCLYYGNLVLDQREKYEIEAILLAHDFCLLALF
ncbi:uncharacterized protein EDB91DRAFT_1089923 [Suillus paluster]|uniref:uncharacterized protein n=1 Tax=Suillus paluster TaxID=48578 RepID=UPI001B85D7BD|nr:uncharacterized protein EDB91DRAFT_1089923 [Suillus paluster]KAG1718635.1 hypothetical protein EDB91DRAFT_1089923 [Suillus paluster]